MLKINNLHTIAIDDNKEILKGLNLEIKKGEVHVIMGPNGSGKSTLANTILNNQKYKITDGDIYFNEEKINDLKTNEIAKKGIFMSFQTPEEIPGISVAHFLKTVKSTIDNEKINLFKFSKQIDENMEKLNIDPLKVNRELNVGFSGGEKKKNEILQLLTFNPKLAILDEIDSGLDVDAIKTVSKGIKMYKNSDNALLIITHSTKLIEEIDVDYVHILYDGKIIKTGDASLANTIEEKGYTEFINEN